METMIVVVARLQSQRLPKKHLKLVEGRPIFEVLLNRIRYGFISELKSGQVGIVIATPAHEENQAFEQFSGDGVSVFYGNADNIPLRELEAAEHYGCSSIVSVDGDDILCSIEAVRAVWSGLVQGYCYVNTSGLPLGMNAFGYSTAFLRESLMRSESKNLETGWGRIFDTSNLRTIEVEAPAGELNLRFTLDYQEDFAFFDEVLRHAGKSIESISDAELIRLVVAHDSSRLNASVKERYWEDFERSLQSEKEGIA